MVFRNSLIKIYTLILFILLFNIQIVSADIIQNIKKGNIESVKMYLEQGGHVNATGGRFGECLLNNAILYGKFDIVKLLVDHGADINARTGMGDYTPLARAVNYSDFESVKLLVKMGANVNRKTGGTYFHYPITLCFIGNFEITKNPYPIFLYLLANGADINVKTGSGRTVLSYAVSITCKPCVLELLKRGSDLSVLSYDKTPLEEAIEKVPIITNFNEKKHDPWVKDSIEIIALLLQNGADANIRTKEGKTLEEVVDKKFEDYEKITVIEDLKITDFSSQVPVAEDIKIAKGTTPELERDRYYATKRIEILRLLKKYK